MEYRVYAQLLPKERDGIIRWPEGKTEAAYKANLRYLSTIHARPLHAMQEATKLVRNPLIEPVLNS